MFLFETTLVVIVVRSPLWSLLATLVGGNKSFLFDNDPWGQSCLTKFPCKIGKWGKWGNLDEDDQDGYCRWMDVG